MTGVRPGAQWIGSLVSEDLIAQPGPARAAAEQAAASDPERQLWHRVDETYAALLAGEPKRARRILGQVEASPELQRLRAALSTWVTQLDGNWYPGNVGAEVPTPPASVTPSPGDGELQLLEHVVAEGPPALLTYRAILNGFLGRGQVDLAREIADHAITLLEGLVAFGTEHELPATVLWARLAQADTAHRSYRPDLAAEVLAEVRASCEQLGLPHLTALSLMMEGDWEATPGSSPEALGVALAPQPEPPVAASADGLARAADHYDAAEQYMATLHAPALSTALQLRRATLAWLSGDSERRRHHLERAGAAAHRNGSSATSALVDAHMFIADVSDGRWHAPMRDVGSGWSLPTSGRLAAIRAWAETDGSTSWCVGLGRLLERSGDYWKSRDDSERATLAYQGALVLQGLEPRIPTRTLATAVAGLDASRNLTDRALARLERLLSEVPEIEDVRGQMFDLQQELEILTGLVGAQRARARTAAAEHAARALGRVRRRFNHLYARALTSGVAPAPEGTSAQQLARLRAMVEGDGSAGLSDLMASAGADEPLLAMLAMSVGVMESQAAFIDFLVPLSHGEHARRRGLIERADQFTEAALVAAQAAPPFATALCLISADRREEARVEVARLAAEGVLDDDILGLLALRAKDYATARAAMDRSGADPWRTADWRVALNGAELALAEDDAAAAADLAERGIALFEDSTASLLRDVDRLAALDEPSSAALYSTAVMAHLRRGEVDEPQRARGLGRAFEVMERARTGAISLAIGRQSVAGAAGELGSSWREAAAAWAADIDRLLAAIDAQPSQDPRPFFSRVEESEGRLRSLEEAVENDTPGVLSARALERPWTRLADVQAQLAEGMSILEYQTVGDDFLVAAVTCDGVQIARREVRSQHLAALVRTHHERCADGWGAGPEADELAALLLEPVKDVVRRAERLVLVPFGPLHQVPIHALPFDGAPLGLQKVCSYAPAASLALGGDRVVATERCVVVGDPAFDPACHPRLRRLPGAATEARIVAAALGSTSVLTGPEATEGDVRRALPDRSIVHLAAHGWLDELGPYSSSIVLAGSDELTVAEMVGMHLTADLAVLSACDTGRGAATLGGDVVGLTRALLSAGVRGAVVSLWPVDDVTACVTMATFYDHLRQGVPPAHALARAQRRIHDMEDAALYGAYADLCHAVGADCDPSMRGLRRGELDDDEPIPPAMGGAAERHWAPFVLMCG